MQDPPNNRSLAIPSPSPLFPSPQGLHSGLSGFSARHTVLPPRESNCGSALSLRGGERGAVRNANRNESLYRDALRFMVKKWARDKTTEALSNNGWRLAAVGGWWRLVEGGGRWSVGGWWRLAVGSCP